MSRWVAVGRVGRPHGLDGAFVVEAASDEPARFAPGARVYAAREPATVLASKHAGGRLVIRLDKPVGRGTVLEVPIAELEQLPEGEYYAFELVGLAVEDEQGRPLGLVAQVAPGVANDVLELDSGLALPLVEGWVRTIEVEAGRIVVDSGLVASE